MKKGFALLAGLLLAAVTTPAAADPQVWPFAFDPNLAPDPASIQQQLTQGAATLPPLPVSELQTLSTDNGAMTLWFWPENAALLKGIGSAGPGLMVWPTTAVKCAKHAAFAMPTLDASDGGSTCAAAASSIQKAITSNLSACLLAEQPELYVYGYSPADVSKDVGNIEDMIGLAGEALTHAGLPLDGVLPPGFVPTLRIVLDKIRHDKLAQSLQAASDGYGHAGDLLSSNASCFDPSVVASLTASLADLAGETADLASYLEQLKAAGEAAAQQENVCLASQSRVRLDLPYPSLTGPERTFLAFWLGGLYWRMRGGGLIPLGSTQEARFYYVQQGFGQIAALVGGKDGQDNTGLPFFTELLVDGWSDWQDMGTGSGDKYSNLIGMTERGQRQAVAAIQGLKPLGYNTNELLTGGLQMGPGYYYAYYPLKDFRYAQTMPSPYSGFIDWATGIGEFNVGAALGLGLARTLLPGKPTGQPPTATLCDNRVCGDDGCGGSCGTCEGGTICNASGQCEMPPEDAGVTDAQEDGPQEGPHEAQVDGPAIVDAVAATDVDAAPSVQDASDSSVASGDGPVVESPASGGGCGCGLVGARQASGAGLVGMAVVALLSTRRLSR